MSFVPTETLSVVGEQCPMNYVRTKLRLEELGAGEILEVLLSEGEGARNVPRSATEEGHEVLSVEPAGDGLVRILVRKREALDGT